MNNVDWSSNCLFVSLWRSAISISEVFLDIQKIFPPNRELLILSPEFVKLSVNEDFIGKSWCYYGFQLPLLALMITSVYFLSRI